MKKIIVEVRITTPKSVPGVIIPMYDDKHALAVTFRWQHSDIKNCVGSCFKTKQELKRLIGDHQYKLFLKGERHFILRKKFMKMYSFIF